MNLKSEILKEHSKSQVIKIVRWIGSDKHRFAQLMYLFLNGEYRIVQRSSWVVSVCGEKHPELILPWLSVMIKKAEEHNVHEAVQRNVVRVLQFLALPKKVQGRAANLCFNFLQSPEAPVAVKAFSMTVLANIAEGEPDLKREVALVIEEMLPYGSAGIRSRGKKVLKQLSVELRTAR